VSDVALTSVTPAGWPRGAGYAHAMSGTGRIVCTSGQIGWDPVTLALADGLVPQVDRALANIAALLQAAGAGPHHLARLTWYVTDRTAWLAAQREIGEAYRRRLGRHFPAMAVVVVAGLLEEGALVEIEATAIVPA